jgi:hypothetical protein
MSSTAACHVISQSGKQVLVNGNNKSHSLPLLCTGVHSQEIRVTLKCAKYFVCN